MNRTELQQVIVNLIVNAIHAMPDGGTLKLRTRDMDDDDGKPGVAIDVADSGVGMTLEVMQRIFDPFFTTKRLKGTGLGLSISRSEEHTSELQSLMRISYAVFCLKKKTKNPTDTIKYRE